MKEQIKQILYDDVDGVFTQLRKGNCVKDDQKLSIISDFVKEVNKSICSNNYNAQDILDATTIIFTLLQYSSAGWPRKLASDLYLTLINKGE